MKKKSLCNEFNVRHLCSKMNCHFVLIHGSFDNDFERLLRGAPCLAFYINPLDFKKRVSVQTAQTGGRTWWTAGYSSIVVHPQHDDSHNASLQEVVYVERGSALLSSQGISWYTSEEEAYGALEQAFIVAKYAHDKTLFQANFEQRRTSLKPPFHDFPS
jgi:hypothetical protein